MDQSFSSPNQPNPNISGAGGGAERPTPSLPENMPVPGAEVAPAPGANPAPVPVTQAPMKPAIDPMALAMGQPQSAQASAAPVGVPPANVPLPNMASDVDVIEPEWVDKAEDVMKTYAGDPYGEEEAVEMLQEDYLKKRYGFDVKEPDADTPKPGSV